MISEAFKYYFKTSVNDINLNSGLTFDVNNALEVVKKGHDYKIPPPPPPTYLTDTSDISRKTLACIVERDQTKL